MESWSAQSAAEIRMYVSESKVFSIPPVSEKEGQIHPGTYRRWISLMECQSVTEEAGEGVIIIGAEMCGLFCFMMNDHFGAGTYPTLVIFDSLTP